eukprot:5911852-Prymnesium_polylepis.2
MACQPTTSTYSRWASFLSLNLNYHVEVRRWHSNSCCLQFDVLRAVKVCRPTTAASRLPERALVSTARNQGGGARVLRPPVVEQWVPRNGVRVAHGGARIHVLVPPRALIHSQPPSKALQARTGTAAPPSASARRSRGRDITLACHSAVGCARK